MRVIAGIAKGRRLASPPGDGTRPPTGRMREALFSSLGAGVVGARVLDLYAGSGAFGLEALSRGARSGTFVERSKPAHRVLVANIESVGLGGIAELEDVTSFLRRTVAGFDLVFVDPPFALDEEALEAVLGLVAERLEPGGVVVVHRRSGGPSPEVPESLTAVDRRRYGDSELWRFEKEDG